MTDAGTAPVLRVVPAPAARVLVIGDLEVTRRCCAALQHAGLAADHLLTPTDTELRAALATDVRAVTILVRGDVIALRYALLIEHLRPGVRLVITLFDRTISQQLVQVVPNCVVTSPAEVAVPAVLAACLGQAGAAPVGRLRSLTDWTRRQLRPHNTSSTILMVGLGGLGLTLAVDWLVTTLALGASPVVAFYAATRVIATVGPGDNEATTPAWYLLFAGLAMLATIGWTALCTAGIVNVLLSDRSVGLVGRLTLPRRDHVIVVGLGQVGLRLCLALRAARVGVVVVERDPRAVNLRLAKQAGVPVLIGHAEDRATLTKLGLARARAIAAMGAEDLDNVEVSIAALAVCPSVRVVIRAGAGDVIAETRSLFHIGEVVDVAELTADAIRSAVLGSEAQPSNTDRPVERCRCAESAF